MICFNFDVLAKPHEEFAARSPDQDGILLWRAMYEVTVGRLAVVVSGSVNTEHLEHWLKVNNIKASTYAVFDGDDREPKILGEKIHRFITAGAGNHLYFDRSPEVIRETLSLGIPSVLVCVPFVVRPEWSDQRPVRSWEALQEEIDKQALAKAERTWKDVG